MSGDIAVVTNTGWYGQVGVFHIIVASTCRRSVEFWLLGNLTLDGKLCLRNDKNGAFV